MNLIDMHCDTICELLSEKTPGQDLKKNNLKVDIEKLKKGGSAAQFFACFVAMDEFLGKSRYEPVSYTHLDVYKRQAIRGEKICKRIKSI